MSKVNIDFKKERFIMFQLQLNTFLLNTMHKLIIFNLITLLYNLSYKSKQ